MEEASRRRELEFVMSHVGLTLGTPLRRTFNLAYRVKCQSACHTAHDARTRPTDKSTVRKGVEDTKKTVARKCEEQHVEAENFIWENYSLHSLLLYHVVFFFFHLGFISFLDIIVVYEKITV